MDYSSLPDDPDHPVESSPWSSSPRATRTGFPPPSSNDLQSSDTSAGGFGISSSDLRQSQSSLTDHEPLTPDPSGRLESGKGLLAEAGEDGSVPVREHGQGYGEHGFDEHLPPNRHETSAPAHRQYFTARPVTRSNIPLPKLHAKVTGLERTGRKDLILRFDVHVNDSQPILHDFSVSANLSNCLILPTDQSTKISDHTISRCTSHSFRIR